MASCHTNENLNFGKKIIILNNKILIEEWVTYSKNFYSFLLVNHTCLLFD